MVSLFGRHFCCPVGYMGMTLEVELEGLGEEFRPLALHMIGIADRGPFG